MRSLSNSDESISERRLAALDLLVGRINYERTSAVPYHARGLKLDRIRQLLTRLGSPERRMKIVHVAGTKGKGSTSAMIASVLSAAGYRTGLFSSPHLAQIEERMVVDSRPASAEEFVHLMMRVWPEIEAMDAEAESEFSASSDEGAMGPTYFEITTALALMHFVDREVDVAVLEVGLGGRLDSTNVCLPEVSVITNISFDHTHLLGTTLAEIAGEKAGIIKPGVPVVSGATSEEAREVIETIADQHGARMHQLGRDFDFRYHAPHGLGERSTCSEFDYRSQVPGDPRRSDGLRLGLLGRHQAANAAVALATLDELRRQGWDIPEAAVREGLEHATVPARVEVVGRRPTVIVDVAHNVASVEALLEVLDESFAPGPRILVFATARDKDALGMLDALAPRFDQIVLTRYENNPRAVSVDELHSVARRVTTRPCHLAATPAEAWRIVGQLAGPGHLISIAGSFFIAAEMRQLVREHPLCQPAGSTGEAVSPQRAG